MGQLLLCANFSTQKTKKDQKIAKITMSDIALIGQHKHKLSHKHTDLVVLDMHKLYKA